MYVRSRKNYDTGENIRGTFRLVSLHYARSESKKFQAKMPAPTMPFISDSVKISNIIGCSAQSYTYIPESCEPVGTYRVVSGMNWTVIPDTR